MLAGFHKSVHVCGCYDIATDGISLTVAIMGVHFSIFFDDDTLQTLCNFDVTTK